MPLDPTILEHYDPTMTAGRLMDNQNVASQIALRNASLPLVAQQTHAAELENQQKQLALDDDAAMREWLKDPKNMYALGKGDLTALAGKVSPTTMMTLQKNMLDAQKSHAQLGTEQLNLHDKTMGELQSGFDGLLQLPDDAARASAWQGLTGQWRANGYLNGINLPQSISGDKDELMQLAAPLQLAKGLNDAALARAKEKAETDKNAAEANLKNAQIPGEQAKSAKDQLVTQAMQDALKNPQQGAVAIDKALPASVDAQANASYKAAWQAAMGAGDVDGAARIVATAAGHAATISQKLNPNVRSAEISDAITKSRLEREGDNPALAAVPPAAASAAVASATKLDNDYIKAREATESMGKLLDLADQGNVAAGANIPMVGVAAANAINGIKRINSAEIAQYGTAGSLMQKIQGKLEGWKDGQPIPSSVRDDIRDLHQQLGEDAYRQYTTGLNSLNQRTGAKFGPTVEAPNIRKSAAKTIPPGIQAVLKSAGPGIHTLSDGSKWMKSTDGTITPQ